jgi:MFS family permease
MQDKPAAAAAPPYPHPAYAWYVVVVLLLAYILAFVDREIIALLVPGIKATLGINDTQMSLLMGGAFAIFYTFFGLLIAWFADRGNRRWLLLAGIMFWSVATMACGLAVTFPLLFLARVAVGAGEATLNPCALSMLKDYFPPDKVGRAIGLYTAGVSSGSGIAFMIGGLVYPKLQAIGPVVWPIVGTVEPWQQVFFYVGAPGLLIGLLLLTVREPARREFLESGKKPEASPLWATFSHVFTRWRAFIVLFVALSGLAIMAYGVGFWIPEFLRRTYGLSNEELGHWVQLRGVVTIVFGLIGVVAGGWLCDILQKRHEDGYVRVCLASFIFLAIGYCSFVLMPTPALAVAFLIPATLGAAAPTAAGAAAVVAIAPPNMRSQCIAMYYFVLNAVGFFIGPTAVAVLTDYVFVDESQLRYSMFVVAAVVSVGGALLLVYNLPHFRAAVREARQWTARGA